MNAFFSKHGKWILAVLGVVLMFLWVLPTGGNQSAGENRLVGSSSQGKIYSDDIQLADSDIRLLQSLASNQLIKYGQDNAMRLAAGQIFAFFGTDESAAGALLSRDSRLHFVLLLQQARAAGIVVSNTEIKDFIEQDLRFDDFQYQSVLNIYKVTENTFAGVIRRFLSIRRLTEWAGTAAQISLPELNNYIIDSTTGVSVGYIPLDATKSPLQGPEPSADQINAQFQAYKEILSADALKKPGEINGHRYPFGYKLPDRVSIEYMVIKYEDVRKACEPSSLTELITDQNGAYKAFTADYEKDTLPKDWEANIPTSATAPATAASQASTTSSIAPSTAASQPAVASTQPATSTTPATSTAPATATTAAAPTTAPVLTAAEKEKQRDMLWLRHARHYLDMQVQNRADQKIRELAERAAAKGRARWKDDPNGHFVDLPIDQWVKYADIAAEIEKSSGVHIEVKATSKLRNADQLSTFTDIGAASYTRISKDSVDLKDLAMHVFPLDQHPTGIPGQLQVQRGVDGPVLRDKDKNAYVYRVVETSPSHVPNTPDEIEEAKKAAAIDIKRVAEFQHLKELGKTVAAEAASYGIRTTAFLRNSDNLHAQLTPLFPRLIARDALMMGTIESPDIPGIGVLPLFSNKAFDLIATLKSAVTDATGLNPKATALTARTPVGEVAVEEKLTVYVMQIDSYSPVSPSELNSTKTRDLAGLRLTSDRQYYFLREWITLKQTAARLNYKDKDGKPLSFTDADK